MRIGVSSRGTSWVSMGPVGWLLFGWLYLAGAILVAVVWLVGQLLILAARGVALLWEKHEAAKAARIVPLVQTTPDQAL